VVAGFVTLVVDQREPAEPAAAFRYRPHDSLALRQDVAIAADAADLAIPERHVDFPEPMSRLLHGQLYVGSFRGVIGFDDIDEVIEALRSRLLCLRLGCRHAASRQHHCQAESHRSGWYHAWPG